MPAVFGKRSYCKSSWEEGLRIALVLGGFNGLPSSFSLWEASGFSCLYVWSMFSDPSLLFPEPYSTHPSRGGFSSWCWYWQFEPKANKELAVCLQCEMTPSRVLALTHTATVRLYTHRLTTRVNLMKTCAFLLQIKKRFIFKKNSMHQSHFLPELSLGTL